MIDFGVDIKIDDKGAAAAIGKVTTELDRMERAHKAARRATIDLMAEGKIKTEQQAEAVKRLTHEFAASERAAEQATHASTGFAGAINRLAGTNLGSLANQITSIAGALGDFGLAGQAIGGFASAIGNAATAAIDWYDAQLRINDRLITMRNLLRPVTDDVEQLMRRTRELADATLTDWGTTIDVYQRVARSVEGVGLSERETLRITETLSKTFAASGRSAQENSAAMLQLSQALGSGVLQGDELKSLRENAPAILKAFADQMGVTTGELKKLGSEGKITTDIMIKGLQGMEQAADRAFAQMERTQAQRDALIGNAVAADPRLINKAVTLGDTDALGTLGTSLAQSGRLAPIADVLGVDDPSLFKVSEFNTQLGKTIDAINEYKKAIEGASGPAADSSPWAHLDEAHKFTGVLIDDLDELGIKAPNATKELQDGLKLLPAGAEFVKTLGNTFTDLGEQIHGAALQVDFLVSKFTDGNALGSISTGLKGLVDGLAERMAALKLWNPGLFETPKSSGAHVRQSAADPWQTSSAMQQLAIGTSALLPQVTGLTTSLRELELGVTDVATGMRDMIVAEKAWADLKTIGSNFVSEATRQKDQREMLEAQGRAARFDLNEIYYPGGKRSGSTFSAERDNTSWGNGELTERGQEQAIAYTKRWTEELEKNRKKWEDVDKFGSQALGHIEDSIVRLVETGKFSFKSLVESILSDLTRLATHRLLMSLLGGGGTASVFGTGATQSFQGMYGGGHAHGGSWTAPRTGGAPDSIPVLFNVSPGEHVQFTPQGQQQAANVNSRVSVHVDPRQLMDVLDGPAGREIVHRHVMKLPKSAFR